MGRNNNPERYSRSARRSLLDAYMHEVSDELMTKPRDNVLLAFCLCFVHAQLCLGLACAGCFASQTLKERLFGTITLRANKVFVHGFRVTQGRRKINQFKKPGRANNGPSLILSVAVCYNSFFLLSTCLS